MEFWNADNISKASLVFSALALLVSLWTAQYTRDSVRESRKTGLASNHQKYVDLLTGTRQSLASKFRALRECASDIYPDLLHLLDRFPCRSEGCLRHVAGRFCHLRTDDFADQVMRNPNYRDRNFPISLWEIEMDEPETMEIKEVVEMVPTAARAQLYRDTTRALKPYWKAFDDIEPDLKLAIDTLEAAIQKSNLEEYPLSLSPKILKNYESAINTYKLLLRFDIFQVRQFSDEDDDDPEGYEISTVFYAVSVLMLVEQSWMWETWEKSTRTWFYRFLQVFNPQSKRLS
jgi:hypothetical protein